jgi:hypothetical protein
MGYICTDCYEISKEQKLDMTKSFCKCNYNNFLMSYEHIDDLFLEIIQVLNQKGYTTNICCSGHQKGLKRKALSYITFECNVTLPYIPSNYRLKKKISDDPETYGEIYYSIHTIVNSKTKKGLNNELLNNSLKVLEWVESL